MEHHVSGSMPKTELLSMSRSDEVAQVRYSWKLFYTTDAARECCCSSCVSGSVALVASMVHHRQCLYHSAITSLSLLYFQRYIYCCSLDLCCYAVRVSVCLNMSIAFVNVQRSKLAETCRWLTGPEAVGPCTFAHAARCTGNWNL